MLPETTLSVTSALECNESMNSKDSMTSSNRQDSEVENLTDVKTVFQEDDKTDKENYKTQGNGYTKQKWDYFMRK